MPRCRAEKVGETESLSEGCWLCAFGRGSVMQGRVDE